MKKSFSDNAILTYTDILRAFTIDSIYCIKNPNITKNRENRITVAFPNERNMEADEQ